MTRPVAGVATILIIIGTTACAGDADEKRISLEWREKHVAYGHLALVVNVDRLELADGTWSADVRLQNKDIVLRIHERFALVATKRGRPGDRLVYDATRFSPGLPRDLGVRQSWRGTMSGSGAPEPGTDLRLRFADFRAVVAPNLVLRAITRHSYRWDGEGG